jgi:hypothetical protein
MSHDFVQKQIPQLPVRKRKCAHFAAVEVPTSMRSFQLFDNNYEYCSTAVVFAKSECMSSGRAVHVPSFLPAFPPSHTYQTTEVR